MNKFTFGPVPSRRLGRSFGVDLVPFKTCSYDCVYCQAGRTTDKTVCRKEYVPVRDVLSEIKMRVGGVDADYVTLSGSGEPTLNSGAGSVIRGIKEVTSIPVAVITNGSLLSEEPVREALAEADLIIPSLDAVVEETFQKVNRPHKSLKLDKVVEGIFQFRKEFKGKLWLEIMFVKGMNDSDEEVGKLISIAEELAPDRVQLNTVVRPPADEGICQVPHDVMCGIRDRFGHGAELIGEYTERLEEFSSAGLVEEIVEVLSRRPCSLDDLVSSTGLNRNEVLKYIASLERKGTVAVTVVGGETYYRLTTVG